MTKKMWSGRFSEESSATADSFNSSLHFDKRLYKYDIEGSLAHAEMLSKSGLINSVEYSSIVFGLKEILAEIENGKLKIEIGEDIHMWVEARLTEKIGDAGRKLHTGRSRNDQVALDLRMFARDGLDNIIVKLKALISILISISENNLKTYMTGFTHLQHAQPVTLAHYMMAYANMFSRDIDRLSDCRKRINVMPLGSGALATTTLPLDRELVATKLQFDSTTSNAMDAVSDRDFVVEYISALSIIMLHLSRISEELIIWSTQEFGFVEFSDAYSTGSSIMPQKKNPDMTELIRGKCGRVFGSLMGILTVMKGLPLAYNKDMQEDKELLFDAQDTCVACLNIICPVLKTIRFNSDKLLESAPKGFAFATEIADFLTKKGLPFRKAHEISGKIVKYCTQNKLEFNDLSLEAFQEFSPLFTNAIFDALKIENIINERKIKGGPAPTAVLENIKEIKEKLNLNS